jgi:hypothetical protein
LRKAEHQRKGPYLWGREQEPKAKGPNFVFGIILTHLFMAKGEDSTQRALMIPFFGDSCQKGGEMSPKQKDRTTTYFNFQKLSVEYFFN